MDIVLPTRFNNPNLPIVQRPGFRDDFDRPAADVLGTTTDGKPWVIHDRGSSTSVWGTYGDGTAGMKDASSSWHIAAADAMTADGTLTAVVATRATSGFHAGLTVRTIDPDNHIQIVPSGTSDPSILLRSVTGGSATTVGQPGPALVEGDTVDVTCSGTHITVAVNGVVAISGTIPDHASATQHGMYAFVGAVGTWENIEFTPA